MIPDHPLDRRPGTTRLVLAVMLGLGALAAPASGADLPADLPAQCRAPLWTLGEPVRLVRSAAVFQRTRRLKIVAIGSSSTAGVGASDRSRAWPARFEEELRRRLPNAQIAVLNQAAMRQTSEQMVARLSEVVAERPDLVLWEVGTAEAVRHLDVEHFFNVVLQGLDRLIGAGIDVVLVDQQYTRDTARIIAFEPYLGAIQRAATMRNAGLFSRHAVMRFWVDSGQFQFDSLRPADFARVADTAYDCIGRLMAFHVIRGLQARD